MSERAAVLRHAHADPEDHLARCVAGDWLADHGEEDLGYAYQWAGRRKKFPERRSARGYGVAAVYEWSPSYTVLAGTPHGLPELVFSRLPMRTSVFRPDHSFAALATALRELRDIVEIPRS